MADSNNNGLTTSQLSETIRYGSVDQQPRIQVHVKQRNCMTIFDHSVIAIGLVLATYIGVLSRMYLSYFSRWYGGVQDFPSFWAQLVGTFIMGILLALRQKQAQLLETDFKILYVSLSTGLCGSLTTFSSWNAEASIVILQLNETSLETFQTVDHPAAAGRVLDYCTVLILGIGMPIAAALLGKNITVQCLSLWSSINFKCKCFPTCLKSLSILLIIISYVLATGSIIVSCVLTKNFSLLFSLIFGGFGTLFRWCLSYFDSHCCLNDCIPFGTLLANSFGSLILAGTIVSKAYVTMETTAGVMVHAVLDGIATGFCGSLTTVSTFVSQLFTLRFHIALFYFIVSIAIAQVLFILILGTYSWTKFY